jgi:hypothetical protein
MPQFQHTFTGKDTGVEIQPLDRLERSGKRMGDYLTQAEELKYKKFQEDKDWYLKQTKLSPTAYISRKNTEAQAELYDKYVNDAAAIVKKAGGFGNLGFEAQNELQRARMEMDTAQAKMNSDLERFKMDKQVMDRDNGRTLNTDDWKRRQEEYFKTGVYSEEPLRYARKSIDLYLASHPVRGQGYTVSREYPGNANKEVPYEVSGRKEDAVPVVVGFALSDPGYQEEAKEEWNSLNETEKAAYFDPNNELTKYYTSLGIDNPVLMNYAEKHWKRGIQENPGTPSFKDRSAGKKSTFDWNIGIGSGHNRNADFETLKDVSQVTLFGKRTYPDFINLGSVNQTPTEAQPIDEIISYESGSPKRVKEVKGDKISDSVRFNIVGYSKSDDVIVVKIADDGDYFRAGDVVALPADKYSDLLRRKPMGIHRENLTAQKSAAVETLDNL